MTFLPIVERELRVAARRPSTYWVRFTIAAGALLLCLLFGISSGYAFPPTLARMLFVAMGSLGLVFALLAGVLFTADCLGVERREGTLGLLLLTDLKGYDVVLGKLAATSLHGLYGLLTVIPVNALTLLLGGVTGAEVARQAAVLLVTLFLSLAVGMLVSAISHDPRHALAGTFLTLLGLATLGPTAATVMEELKWLPFQSNLLPWLSPGYSLAMAAETEFARSPEGYFGSLAVQGLLAVGLLGAACWRVPCGFRAGEERATNPLASASRQPAAAAPVGDRAAVLTRNPFLWLARRRAHLGRGLRWTLGGLFFLWLALHSLGGIKETREAGFMLGVHLAYVLHLFVKCLLAMESCRIFSADHRRGEMEMLLATPLSPRLIPEGHKTALRRLFRAPLGLLVLVNLTTLLLLLAAAEATTLDKEDRTVMLMMFSGGLVVLPFDVLALTWVGMHMGLRQGRQQQALLATLGPVVLGPVAGLVLLILTLVTDAVPGNPSHWLVLVLGCWFGLRVGVSGALAYCSRRRLLRSFRPLAAGDTNEGRTMFISRRGV